MFFLRECNTLYFNLKSEVFFIFVIQLSNMTTNFSMDSVCHEDKKNIKNIYVQKINSLMKLSKDTLLKDDFEASNHPEKKKFKKTISQIDRNTLKLQKNRESAKKARLRKKIYIKMLQNQIQCFKRIKVEGDQLNEESEVFLSQKNSKQKDIQMNELIEHDANVDKFLSGSDLGQVLKIQNKEFQKKLKKRDQIVEELYQLSSSSLVKKLKGSKNLEVFQPILKKQARQNMNSFQNLINRISHHYDMVKNSFRKIHELTQKTKKLTRHCKSNSIETYQLNKFSVDLLTVSQFMQKMDLNRQCQYNEPISVNSMMDQNHKDYLSTERTSSNSSIYQDLNLHSTQRLLIRSEKFFQHTLFDQEE